MEVALGKRSRVDSVLHGLFDEARDLKRMTADGKKWKKISHIIAKPTTQLLLFEVPRGVTKTHTYNLFCSLTWVS